LIETLCAPCFDIAKKSTSRAARTKDANSAHISGVPMVIMGNASLNGLARTGGLSVCLAGLAGRSVTDDPVCGAGRGIARQLDARPC
jgi:hypothetical protein